MRKQRNRINLVSVTFLFTWFAPSAPVSLLSPEWELQDLLSVPFSSTPSLRPFPQSHRSLYPAKREARTEGEGRNLGKGL